jgi:hypothetical protein
MTGDYTSWYLIPVLRLRLSGTSASPGVLVLSGDAGDVGRRSIGTHAGAAGSAARPSSGGFAMLNTSPDGSNAS